MKRPGYCTLCEKPVFEFRKERPVRPLKEAWRVEMLLSDDSTADMTFCEFCLDNISGNLEKIWEICLAAYDHDEEKRNGDSPEGVAAFLEHARKQHLVHEVGRARWGSLI